jgi:purine-binding chemotaxis protein CheW
LHSLTILANSARHAIALRDIAEIIRVPATAPVPLAPAWVTGLINHRGAALPMLDLGLLLGGEAAVPTAHARVLIATVGAGLLVDGLAADPLPDTDTLDLAALLQAATLGGRPIAQGGRRIAEPNRTAPEDRSHVLLGVTVAGHEYAFVVEQVEEVAAYAAETEAQISMVWRGQKIPAVKLRSVLGGPDGAAEPTRVAVVRLADGSCAAMLVDGFSGILRVPQAQRHAVPSLLARGRPGLDSICRLNGGARLVCVLSPDRLMHGEGGAGFAPPAATGKAASAAGGEHARFIVARIGPARFAAPLASVEEVLRATSLAPVPGAQTIDGVRSLRGRVLPVIDLRRLAGMAPGPPTGAERILVCNLGATGGAGLLVDAVERIVAVAPHDTGPAPALLEAAAPLVTHVLTPPGGGPPLPVLDLRQLAGDRAAPALAALMPAEPGLAA